MTVFLIGNILALGGQYVATYWPIMIYQPVKLMLLLYDMEDILYNVDLLDIINVDNNNIEVVVMNVMVFILNMHDTVGRKYVTIDLLDIVNINMNNVEVFAMNEMAVILDMQDIVGMKNMVVILKVVDMVNMFQAQ